MDGARRRVVVTGLGAVSPVGIGTAAVGVVVGLDAAQHSIARAALALEQTGPLGVDAYAVIQGMPNSAGALIAQAFGLKGAQFAVAAACASGATSLLTGWNLLRLGFVDAV